MKVLISGAGIAGLTLAWWLDRLGHEIALVEKAPSLRDEGYMMDFFGPGFAVAEEMGLLPELARIHYPVPRLVFMDGKGRERASVSYSTVRRLFRGRHFNFMRGDLVDLLQAAVPARVSLRFGTTIVSVRASDRQVEVKLSNGSAVECDLLVGADGVHSRVRELVFGEERRFSRALGFHTAAFIVERPPRTLASDGFYMMSVPDRQVAIYPVRGGRLATFFLHRASESARDVGQGGALTELRSVYRDIGWIVPEVLAQCDPSRLYFDDVLQTEMPSWTAARIALVGDACGCVSLIAGQGASLAMAGARFLAGELERAPGRLATALACYELAFRPVVQRRQAAGRRLARWFVPSDRVHMAVRDLVLRLAGSPITRVVLRRRFVGA